VLPHIEFVAPSWSPWLTGDIEKLEKVQEKAVKMVAGLRAKDYRENCTKLGLETLEERRQNQDLALLAHKMTKDNSPMLQLIRGDNRLRTR
jgi:ribonucleases P/MRP protein subunit RPP40